MVSVIVPCFNRDYFLGDTLKSIQEQSYHNWECIIVNDGSNDNTEQVANEYCRKDDRFKYIWQENNGPSIARNTGLSLSVGDFVQFLDSDDIIHVDKLKKQIESLQKEDADVLVCGYRLFKGNLRNTFENYLSSQPYILSLEGFLYKWAVNFAIPIHAGLFRRSFLIQNNIKFNESVEACEDYIFWSELALADASFSYQKEKLAFYRVHNESITNDVNRMCISQIASTFEVYDSLPKEMRIEFKKKISRVLMDKLSKSITESVIKETKNTIEFKLGYSILKPFVFISRYIKKLIFISK